MKIPYLDYCDSRGVDYFLLGPTVQKLSNGHGNTTLGSMEETIIKI